MSAGDQDEWWEQSHRDSPFQVTDQTRARHQPMDSVNQLLIILVKSSSRGCVLYMRRADDVGASDRVAKAKFSRNRTTVSGSASADLRLALFSESENEEEHEVENTPKITGQRPNSTQVNL